MTEPPLETKVSPRVGRLGELEVELQLANAGWHPVRLDTAEMASNADLIAVNREHRVAIQVKTTDGQKQRGNTKWLQLGYSTSYLQKKKPFFNSKRSPLIADVVVGVMYQPNASRFFVFPVALVEKLCCCHADLWYSVPAKKRDTGLMGTRSDTFPIYLLFEGERDSHREHYDRMKRNVLAYEDAWDVLKEQPNKLRDPKAWSLLD